MSNNEININIKITKKHLTVALIAIVATSLIIPYQIFAENKDSEEEDDNDDDGRESKNDKGQGSPGGGTSAPPEGDIGIAAIPSGTCVAWASNEIVDKSSWYAVMCTASVSGTVNRVVMDFPDTYNVGGTGIAPILQAGLGSGNLAASAGAVLTFTLTTAKSVPAGATFKIVFGHVINPSPPGPPATYSVQVTTKTSAGTIIEAFPATAPVNLEFVDSAEVLDNSLTAADLAPNSVDSSKIVDNAVTSADIANDSITAADVSPSFMKVVFLADTDTGLGWDPDGSRKFFNIFEPDLFNGLVLINEDYPCTTVCGRSLTPTGCTVQDLHPTGTPDFFIQCVNPPPDGVNLRYIVMRP